MTKILLDTDIGNDMDDMQALAYLLSRNDAEILGITTVTGEPEVRAELADMMCRLANKNIPVYSGSGVGLSGKFRQKTVSPKEKVLTSDFPHGEYRDDDGAVGFLRRTIRSNPGELTLCCIGPLTNIARLFELDPEIPEMLSEMIIMGGRFGEVDTARWGEQEWNIINDIEAAKVVFGANVKKVRVFGVELTSRVFRTDTSCVADEAEAYPPLIPFSRAIRTSREAWYHDVIALSAIYYDDGMTFERGRISVTDAGDTVFTPDDSGNHLLMTSLDIGKFFAHFQSQLFANKG